VRILIYGINYFPELTGIGKYTGEMAEWLAARGHDVRIVTAPPYYPAWHVADGYSRWKYSHERLNGVKVWRCPLYVPANQSGLKRIFHLASFALSSLPVMIRQIFWKPDVVLVIEPPLFCAPMAWLTARLSRAKCWLHVQDFEVDAAFDLGIIPFAWMKKLVSAIERWLMQRFDGVSTISGSMVKRLVEKGVQQKKTLLFPNWADIQNIRADAKGALAFRRLLDIPEQGMIVLYSGNMGEKQGLELVIEAADLLRDQQHLFFALCGEGAIKERLQALVKEKQLENVQFLSLQPANRLAGMLSSANVHLVVQKAHAADLVMPSKLTNILSVGGHAIVTANEDTELGQLAKAHPGVLELCPPEDVNTLAQLISAATEAGKEARVFNAKARQYAEDYLDRDRILASFTDELERCKAD